MNSTTELLKSPQNRNEIIIFLVKNKKKAIHIVIENELTYRVANLSVCILLNLSDGNVGIIRRNSENA